MQWNYPQELPVVEHREEILAAIRENPVVVIVSETGSGKTTQLPKMVAEALGVDGGRIGCTQPRRIAAASVSKRVAEELKVPLGDYVGYQVRFEDRTTRETRIKFMTDGILLAETQGDRDLNQYEALILDEAHERSLNIDFLLGYVKRLLERRKDLKLVISSATLDAGSFAEFFSNNGVSAPVIEAPGRMFPVTELFLPPFDDEELPQHVARAVDQLGEIEPNGDVLIFLPGEREIRECADVLEGRQYRGTEVLPLFARLGLGDQQRVFNPGNKRRLILATNVAETYSRFRASLVWWIREWRESAAGARGRECSDYRSSRSAKRVPASGRAGAGECGMAFASGFTRRRNSLSARNSLSRRFAAARWRV